MRLHHLIAAFGLMGALAACSGDEGPKGEGADGTAGEGADGTAGDGKAAKAAPAKPAENRVVIIGFDGVDPDWIERWRRELPSIDRLLQGQRVTRLGTTTPPQSPVAWSTFATSMNPGGHGIFDFVARDPSTYFPMVGTNSYKAASFDGAGKLSQKATGTSPRKGVPFWEIAAEQEKRVRVLFVPYSFPPGEVTEGSHVLSGLGVPDLRLTNSTSFVMSSDYTAEQAKEDESGVDLIQLTREGDGAWKGTITGPRNVAGSGNVEIDVAITPGEAGKLTIKAGDTTIEGTKGSFTDWAVLGFPVSNFYTASASVRFYPLEVSKDAVEVYMTPLMVDPAQPYLDISSPPEFAAELWKEHGEYKTIGWEHDTSALNAEVVPDSMFAADLRDIFKRRLDMTMKELEKNDAELFISVFTETDRAAHMFTRLTDPTHPAYDAKIAAEYGGFIKETYLLMDQAIGTIAQSLNEGDRLIILSDHGFQTFKRGFNTNTWLVDNGYLKLKGGSRSDADGLLPGRGLDVDWGRTQAYAYGTGQIYLNVKGREKQGIVDPAKAEALAKEIAGKIVQVTDGKRQVLSNAYVGSEVYSGSQLEERGPDIQLAFVDGYQSSRKTSLGGVPLELFEDNHKKWSGDHAASDAKDTEGVLISNLGAFGTDAHIADIAPTALSMLGVEIPPHFEGKVLEKR